MKKECMSCTSWKPVVGTDVKKAEFGNCRKIVVGKDVRIAGYALQTALTFCCKFYNGKEVKNADGKMETD